MMNRKELPVRWAFKHGAFYYRPRPAEKELFDNKTWFRLGTTYHAALRAFADRKEIEAGASMASVVDRYQIEVLPLLKPNTQRSYIQSLNRIRSILGHNRAAVIGPQIIYKYMDAVAKAKSMGVANTDLKVINALMDYATRWGTVTSNNIKGQVRYYRKRDGLPSTPQRYVEDWELEEWEKEATPAQKAFAALVMLTGARKTDVLSITLDDDQGTALRVMNRKTGKEQLFNVTPSLRAAIDYAVSIRKPGTSRVLITNAVGGSFVGANDRCESFDRAWRQSMARAIKKTRLESSFTRHDLRAKVGSDADSEQRAQQLLNHSSPSMTRRHYRRKTVLIEPTE